MLVNYAFSYLLGTCLLFAFSSLPATLLVYSSVVLILLFSAVLLLSIKDNYILAVLTRCIMLAAIAFAWGFMQVKAQQERILLQELEQKLITVTGYVESLPQIKANSLSFKFKIDTIHGYTEPKNKRNKNKDIRSNIDPEIEAKITKYLAKQFNSASIKLNWQTNLSIKLGQKWQFTVKLKRPHGFANPGGFDLEKYCFQQRLVAVGYVNSKMPAKLIAEDYSIRNWLQDKLTLALPGKEFADIIAALAIGAQQNILAKHWQVFQKLGLSHLLSVSGLHIGLVAGAIYSLTTILWCFRPRKLLLIAGPTIAAMVAISAASTYAVLAGLALATKRAILMLAIALLAVVARRKITAINGFSIAVIVILVADPLVILSTAFWLSFTAVAILLYSFAGRKKINYQYIRLQLVLTLGLLPLGIIYFGGVSLIAPLANLIVVPYISILVIPLILIGVGLTSIWTAGANYCWQMAEYLLAVIWPSLEKLANLKLVAITLPEPTCLGVLLAGIGVIWLLAPKGFPGRIFGTLGVAGLFMLNPYQLMTKTFMYGDVAITMLDVGQGLSVFLTTKNHTLLYDTGPEFKLNLALDQADNQEINHPSAGELVILPYLRSQGIDKLNKIIVSHADLDHAGGLPAILNNIMPQQILTPDPEILQNRVKENYVAQLSWLACQAGQHWEWDGVQFEILHPGQILPKRRNDQSCVLKVTTQGHSILFTGDISSVVERELLLGYAEKLKAEVLIIPHHGSASSSAIEFIQQVQPKQALASVGYLNMYGHPKDRVLNDYQQYGSKVFVTDQTGAIEIKLFNKSKDINISCYRINKAKFWHERE